ncbi:MAG: hypothetical protein FWE24_09945 [Defluviitaleaceae bacterium]|nr:hypothetical protein [Defluviitaleaceae bacterium]
MSLNKQDEHDYKRKERWHKRIIAVLLIICVASVAMNILNAHRDEQIRQIYMNSIWGNLQSISVLLNGLYIAIENEDDSLKTVALENLRYTTGMMDTSITRLSFHQNFNNPTPSMRGVENHVRSLVNQVRENPADTEVTTAALDFIVYCLEEILELIDDLTVVYEDRNEPDYRMNISQFFDRINAFTVNVENEGENE